VESLAQAVASDWNGDYGIALQNGDKLTMIWVVAFAAESTASSFAAIYHDALDRIHGARTPHRVASGRMVVALVEDAAINSDPLLRELWLRTAVIGGPPPPPKKGWLEDLLGFGDSRGAAAASADG
jgi:hypothetical protein